MEVLFDLISAFLFSPRFPIISLGELIRTLASENKNPTILNMIGFRLYIRCTVINSIRELITKVMWFDDRHKIQDKISVLFNYYNDTRFKINPSFVLNCLK